MVTWEIAAPLPLYTIAELSAAFPGQSLPSINERRNAQRGYARTRPATVDRGTSGTKRAPRGTAFTPASAKDARHRRWGYTLMDLFYLCSYREGYETGHRHYALFWIAHFLNRALPPEPGKRREITRICWGVNNDLRPPLPADEAREATTKGLEWEEKWGVSNKYLADTFGVTREEAKLLRKLRPWATSHQDVRRATVADLRAEWIDAKGKDPTVDELTRELDLAGDSVSRATVARYLRALRTATSPSATGRTLGQKTSAKGETGRRGDSPGRGQP